MPDDYGSRVVVPKLDAAAERVRGLKRKLDDLQPSALRPSVLRDRLSHIDGALLEPAARARERREKEREAADNTGRPDSLGIDVKPPEDKTLDRYIIDHLMRTGRMKTAKSIATAQGIEVSGVLARLGRDQGRLRLTTRPTLISLPRLLWISSSLPSWPRSSPPSARSTRLPRLWHGAARTAAL